MTPKRKILTKVLCTVAVAAALSASPLLQASDAGMADITVMPSGMTISPPGVANVTRLTVRIAAPDDTVTELKSAGEAVLWSAAGKADGHYRYEAYVTTQAEGAEDSETTILRGRLNVHQGMIMEGEREGEGEEEKTGQLYDLADQAGRLVYRLLEVMVPATHAVNLTASALTPTVNYEDTGIGGGTETWETRGVRSSTDCGGTTPSRFEIRDMRGVNTVFRACSNDEDVPSHRSIVVDQLGDITLANDGFFFDRSTPKIGINTITPQEGLHAVSTSGKASMQIRLENTADSTWDIGQDSIGNFDIDLIASPHTEPNNTKFAIEDTTGDVGVGTGSPAANLHVYTSEAGYPQVFLAQNNGSPNALFRFKTAHAMSEIDFNKIGDTFRLNMNDGDGWEMELKPSGAMEIKGALTQNSDRNNKQGIEPVDGASVLEAVASLPVSTWEYKDQSGVKHLGPMAQDFHAAFGLGKSPTGISSIDTGGVALAAIQGLNEIVLEKDREISAQTAELIQLQQRVVELEAQQKRMDRLEQLLSDLAAKGDVALR